MTADARAALDAHLGERELALAGWAEDAARELLPLTGAEGEGLNRRLLRGLAERGLLERLYAPDGISAMSLCLIREALARVSTEAETAFAVQGLGAFPILQAGAPELVEAWIPRIAAGEATPGFALTEPEAGSDVARLSLRAERDGGGFRLSGEKVWISNAPEADVYSVFARTTEGVGARGITAFAVPRDADGLGGEPLRLISPHPIGRLTFDGVYVPEESVLGEVDRGMGVAMRTLDLFRPSVGAFAVGMARRALDLAVDRAATRQAFGGSLSELQGVSHQLADVATAVQAARLLVHSAARAYDAGIQPVTQVAAMSKLLATEVAQRAVDLAVQVHGAAALEQGHPLEHLYRDVRAPRIYEGASEVQREIVARALFAQRPR